MRGAPGPDRVPPLGLAGSVALFGAGALLLFLTTTLVQAYVIPTGSMEDTLMIGDHLLVDKLAYAPAGTLSGFLLPYTEVERGDIIVFRYPIDISQTFVKRAIGVPGDRIKIVNKEVYLNGKKLDEPYTYHKTDYIDSYRDNFPGEPNVHVEQGAYEMLTDSVVNGEIVVPPFELRLNGLGSFGGGKPRAIFADIEPSEGLEALRRANERAAREAGLPPEGRNFKPHVTLARLRGARADAVAAYLQRQGGVGPESFTVSRFVLYSSRNSVGGGPYVVEAAYPLED